MSSKQPTDLSLVRATRRSLAGEPQATTVRELLASGDAGVFRQLVDDVLDYAIFLLTPDGHIASWNAGAQHIKGYDRDEIVGRHFSVFYESGAVQRGWPAEELSRAASLGRFEDEGWRVRKDGTRFWANVVITALHDADGRLLGFSKVTRDLSERKAQEEKLREGERNLRMLIEGVSDYAIYSLDVHGVITSWNLGAQRIKGYAAHEAIGRHFSIFYPPEAVASGWPQEELKRAAARGRYENEGWRLRKDGTRIWVNVVLGALRDADGALLGYSKITRDLTERRRHEQELRQREENLRLLVEGVKDHAMFVLDAQGRVQSWNYGAQRLLGYAAAQVMGMSHAALYADDERDAGRPEADLAAAAAAGYVSGEGWRRRCDGTTFWAAAALNLLRDDAAGVRGYVCILHDLSERKRVEALETEGRRLTEFIAMLSHELRNPLAPIGNAVAILRTVAHSPEAAWCLDLVSRQVGQLSRLVDDLLDVSRITSGKIRLETGPLELNTLVRMALEAMRPTLGEQQHVLSLRPAPRPVQVIGDPARLTQVVTNLLNNADKYTPPGGRIEVSVRVDGKLAALQVRDNGIGMSAGLLQRAFEPFVQGERTLERAQGGMGIGLTLVRRIVELHGGSITAASAGAGQGTTLTVMLPLAPAIELLPEPEAPAAAQDSGAGRRVLVVDDNADAAESLAELLRMTGHEVQVAYDGAQALSFAAALHPSVVLLDIGLPGMDGYEVARRLKALPGLAAVRLIALTGYSQESDRQAASAAGFALHLSKPIDFERLRGLLE